MKVSALVTSAALAALGVLSAGCSSSPAGPGTDLTYHQDTKPIVDAKCTACHVAGGIAPFALTTYAEVLAQQAAIRSAVSTGVMPPWPPALGCSDYVGDRSLTAEQIKTLTAWIDGGSPEGDPGAKPEPVDENPVRLSRVDMTLAMPVAYTPQLRPDDYHCFIVDWPNTETTYVTGVGVQPGTPSIVHHVIAFLAKPDQVAEYQALDDAEPGPGYTCFGGPGGTGQPGWVGAWAPGAQGADYPPGTGLEIPPGSKIILQVHYNTSTAKPVPDLSSVLLKTEKTVDKKAAIMPWADPGWVQGKMMNIPAHSKDATHSFTFDPTPYMDFITDGAVAKNQPFTIHSAALHMHTRGTRAFTHIARAGGGGDECMLDIEHWNFHWQGSYGFAQTKTFNPGDQITLECHWNNPDPMDVNWGEGTGDEMCLGTYYVTQ
jgi:hypothetical protein